MSPVIRIDAPTPAALLLTALPLVACTTPEPREELAPTGAGDEAPATAAAWSPVARGDAFGERWWDGRAELASYELTYPRYGELREGGTAVAITVAEHLDLETRVKPDDPDAGVSTLKLNLAEDFQTGIYDYQLMTSAWVGVGPTLGHPAGAPLKVAFSAQEWCGMTFELRRFEADRVETTLHSYFDGEADRSGRVPRPDDGFAEDALLLWARGLAGPRVEAGASVEVPLLRAAAVARLRHVPTVYDRATLTRAADTRTVEVPAGSFEAEVATVTVLGQDGPPDVRERTWTFWVEAGGDRRVLRYARSDGLDARLVASDRTRYWQQNSVADEPRLDALGLSRRPPRTP